MSNKALIFWINRQVIIPGITAFQSNHRQKQMISILCDYFSLTEKDFFIVLSKLCTALYSFAISILKVLEVLRNGSLYDVFF